LERPNSPAESHEEEGQQGQANEESNARLSYLKLTLERNELKLRATEHLEVLIQRYVPRDRYKSLVLILLLGLAVFTFNSIFEFLNEVLVASVTELTMLDLRNVFYRHVVRMDLSSFTQQKSSELMARFTNDMKALTQGVEIILKDVVKQPLNAAACLGFACWMNWRLTLVALGLVPAAVVVMAVIGGTMKRAARRSLESMSSIYQILQESFQGIRIVKAFTTEAYERMRFYRETRNYYRKSMRIARLEAMASPVLGLVAISAMFAAVLAGSYLVINKRTDLLGVKMAAQEMDAESMFLFFALLWGASDPIRKLSGMYGRIQKACASADRIYAFMDSKPAARAPILAPRMGRHQKTVEMVDIQFSYAGSRQILENINLKVSFGETIAVVGPNGCGKTTLLNLLPRFYDPQRGQILIDGVDIRSVQKRSLRQQFGIVTQETILFNDTVFNNIAYGCRRATQSEVEAAAKKAYAHRFIEELSKGYETIVGEKAVKLSGGQRQRIALARAILRNPAILILDEATSALDVESEALIQKVLEEFTKNRTTFLITHRLASLQLADRIVVMNAGRIEDQGTHDELTKRCAVYARLHEIHLTGLYANAG
jgi:subfamily B ATP-binding cassette protein MsbA